MSERELEILQLVATGAANKEIARQLLISPNTVKVHLRNIFAKIGVTSRTEATLYAIQIGLINPTGQESAPLAAPATMDGAPPNGNDAEHHRDGPGVSFGQAAEAALPAEQPKQGLDRLRNLTTGQYALIALIALLLVSSGVLAARWFAPAATPAPEAVNLLSITATPSTRWAGKEALPVGRKGMGAVAYNNEFYLIAGETGTGPDAVTQRYSLVDNQWQTLAPKPLPVSDVKAALLGERIYVPGGRTVSGEDSAVFEVYDPRADSWAQLAPLPEPLSGYALAAFEGHLFVFGGKSGDQYVDSVYEYFPDQDRWIQRTPLPRLMAFAGAAVVDNRIFIIGGFDGERSLTSNYAYRPAREASGEAPWETFASLPAGRYAMAISSLSNIIYLAGGLSDETMPAAPATLQYLPQSDQWMIYDSPAVTLGAHGVMLPSEGFLHFIGGEIGPELVSLHQSYQALYFNQIPIIQKDQ